MVIEMLTFEVPANRLEAWLHADAIVWTAFLESQPGFVRKEVWRSGAHADAGSAAVETVHAVIWWESLELWKAITMDEVAVVDDRMATEFGEVSPAPTMRSFTTLT